jgi:DNA-binding CsgD family transcriptional regulator
MIYKSEIQKTALEKQGQYLQKFNQEAKKIKPEQEQEIINLYNRGLSAKEIGKKFNCSKNPILKVLKNIPKRSSWSYSTHHSKNQFGDKNGHWKGGIKSIYDRFRGLKTYWAWRTAVLTRDFNKCTKCNSTNKLHAHHLITLKALILEYCIINSKEINKLDYSDLTNDFFYSLDNGLTLCEDCHKAWHKEHGKL